LYIEKILMKSLLLFLSLTLVLAACTDKQVIKNKETKSLVKPIRSNSKLTLGVTGMVCKMGCGGAIRKELLATNAVEKVEVDFVEDKEAQLITVYYNNSLSSKEKLLKVITKMNDKQFTAETISESSYTSDKK